MDQNILFLLISPLSVAVAIGTAIFNWKRHRSSISTRLLTYSLLMATFWLVFNDVELLSPNTESAIRWTKVEYIFIAFSPVFWFAFSLSYTQNKHLQKASTFLIFMIIPLLSFLLLLTNDSHHLFWREAQKVAGTISPLSVVHGPFYYIFSIYCYLLLLTGSGQILREQCNDRRVYRAQSIWMILGALLPLSTNIVYVFKLIPGLNKDFTPISFVLSSLFFAIATSRHKMADLVPIARSLIIDHITDGLVVLDLDGWIVDVNAAFQRISKVDPDQLIGKKIDALPGNFKDIPHENTNKWKYEITTPSSEGVLFYEVHMDLLTDQKQKVVGRLITYQDVTERKQLLETVEKLARLDPLTGLYNRRHFYCMAELELKRSLRMNKAISFILLDLDNFKPVNDWHGHQVGDELLQIIAVKIKNTVRKIDTLARYGGDEFILMLPETDQSQAQLVAQRICEDLTQSPILTQAGELRISASLGLVSYAQVGESLDLHYVVSQADQAMYAAKEKGKGCMVSILN